MVVGTAATAIKLEQFSPQAWDILDKRRRISENKRESLTFDELWHLIDHSHLDAVCWFQWVRTLVNFVPQLDKQKGEVQKLYRSDGRKYFAMLRKSQVQPLPTNGKNETVTSDLAKSLREIFSHIGQTESSYTPRLILTGGDGLTYERMVQLKNYLQFHENTYERLDILKPILEIWHTKWTDLSRIYEAHWDSLTSNDPSSLGHSANKIKRKAPSNLKKVDYYPYSQLAYQILEARMLDCWVSPTPTAASINSNIFRIILCGKDGNLLDYFNRKAAENDLPTITTLLESAEKLQ